MPEDALQLRLISKVDAHLAGNLAKNHPVGPGLANRWYRPAHELQLRTVIDLRPLRLCKTGHRKNDVGKRGRLGQEHILNNQKIELLELRTEYRPVTIGLCDHILAGNQQPAQSATSRVEHRTGRHSTRSCTVHPHLPGTHRVRIADQRQEREPGLGLHRLGADLERRVLDDVSVWILVDRRLAGRIGRPHLPLQGVEMRQARNACRLGPRGHQNLFEQRQRLERRTAQLVTENDDHARALRDYRANRRHISRGHPKRGGRIGHLRLVEKRLDDRPLAPLANPQRLRRLPLKPRRNCVDHQQPRRLLPHCPPNREGRQRILLVRIRTDQQDSLGILQMLLRRNRRHPVPEEGREVDLVTIVVHIGIARLKHLGRKPLQGVLILVKQSARRDHAQRLSARLRLQFTKTPRHQADRLVPRRRHQVLTTPDQRSIDTVTTVDKVDCVTPHRAEEIVIDSTRCPATPIPRHRPDQLLTSRSREH